MPKRTSQLLVAKSGKIAAPQSLIRDVRTLIEQARDRVARSVNSGLVALYWHIGARIRQDALRGKRADYGERIVATLSQQLQKKYGAGFNKENLHRMVKFAEAFPDHRIVATLSQQLGWSHFVELIHLDDALKRDFYAEMCRIEKWSVRALRHKIGHLLYERTAVAKKPKTIIRREIASLRKTDQLTPDLVFKDHYFLDFLGLKGPFQEKDLETAILREMESFILEMGDGFSFVARQKRISVDADDYYLDLLFYHRRLKRLVAIELKLGRFRAEYKGQMELYLKWLNRYERQRDEAAPIGLILCAGKADKHVELLELSKSGIRVAEYMTELPSRKLLEKKLQQAIQSARAMIARAAC